MTGRERSRSPRRWRALALLVPLALVLGACADDAPLDTLDPQGPESQMIHNLAVPVFLDAWPPSIWAGLWACV